MKNCLTKFPVLSRENFAAWAKENQEKMLSEYVEFRCEKTNKILWFDENHGLYDLEDGYIGHDFFVDNKTVYKYRDTSEFKYKTEWEDEDHKVHIFNFNEYETFVKFWSNYTHETV